MLNLFGKWVTKPLSGLEGQISIALIEIVFMLIGVERRQDIFPVLLKWCFQRPGSRGRLGPGGEEVIGGSAPVGGG